MKIFVVERKRCGMSMKKKHFTLMPYFHLFINAPKNEQNGKEKKRHKHLRGC